MVYRVLDPTSEDQVKTRLIASRLESLEGTRVGFISNGKEGTKGFFSQLERILYEEFKVASVILRTKTNYSAPAETAIIEEAKTWDLVISGIGD